MAVTPSLKKWLILVIKILVTGGCLWYVVHKIDWLTSWQTIQNSNALWLFCAVLLIIGSKITAAFRLNIYFKNIGV